MKLNAAFKHRNFWLGIATILIIYSHSELFTYAEPFYTLKQLSYIGVDFFVFASGVGCYYSLDKNADPLGFLQRRLKRLGSVYLCFIIPWMLWRMATEVYPKKAVIGNLIGLESFISWDYHFNWYISAMLLFYVLAPYFKQLTDSFQKYRWDIFTLLFLVGVGIPFWQATKNIIIIARLPIFYLGLVYAKLAKQGYLLQKKEYFLQSIYIVFGLALLWLCYRYTPEKLWSHGFHWYPLIPVIPGFCIFLSLAGNCLDQNKITHWIYHIISVIGVYSFEVFLVHIPLFQVFTPWLSGQIPTLSSTTNFLISTTLTVIGCFLLNRFAKFFSRFCFFLLNIKKHDQPD